MYLFPGFFYDYYCYLLPIPRYLMLILDVYFHKVKADSEFSLPLFGYLLLFISVTYVFISMYLVLIPMHLLLIPDYLFSRIYC